MGTRDFRASARGRRQWTLFGAVLFAVLAAVAATALFDAFGAGGAVQRNEDLWPVHRAGIAGTAAFLFDFRKPLDVSYGVPPGELFRQAPLEVAADTELKIFALATSPSSPRLAVGRLWQALRQRRPSGRGRQGPAPRGARLRRPARADRHGPSRIRSAVLPAPRRAPGGAEPVGAAAGPLRPTCPRSLSGRGVRGHQDRTRKRARRTRPLRFLRHDAARGLVLASRSRTLWLALRGVRRNPPIARLATQSERRRAQGRSVLRAPARGPPTSRVPSENTRTSGSATSAQRPSHIAKRPRCRLRRDAPDGDRRDERPHGRTETRRSCGARAGASGRYGRRIGCGAGARGATAGATTPRTDGGGTAVPRPRATGPGGDAAGVDGSRTASRPRAPGLGHDSAEAGR